MRTVFWVALATLTFPVSSWSQDKKPNVLIFLSDDQGWGDLSIHGNKNISTPNIDSLAKDGALFEATLTEDAVLIPTKPGALGQLLRSADGFLGLFCVAIEIHDD